MSIFTSRPFRITASAVMLSSGLVGVSSAVHAQVPQGITPAATTPLCSTLDDLAAGQTATCDLAPGETITFTLVGGNGGNGGAGADSVPASLGLEPATSCPTALNSPVFPNAPVSGGVGGVGGLGAALSGSYTNSGSSALTLELVAGVHGADGVPGTPCYAYGSAGVLLSPDGMDGGDGTASSITAVNGAVEIAFAGGGTGGKGGTGVSIVSEGDGANGVNGSVRPNPLPTGWKILDTNSTPRVEFSAGVTPTTTTPLPETGTSSGTMLMWALALMSLGAVSVRTVARRHD